MAVITNLYTDDNLKRLSQTVVKVEALMKQVAELEAYLGGDTSKIWFFHGFARLQNGLDRYKTELAEAAAVLREPLSEAKSKE